MAVHAAIPSPPPPPLSLHSHTDRFVRVCVCVYTYNYRIPLFFPSFFLFFFLPFHAQFRNLRAALIVALLSTTVSIITPKYFELFNRARVFLLHFTRGSNTRVCSPQNHRVEIGVMKFFFPLSLFLHVPRCNY